MARESQDKQLIKGDKGGLSEPSPHITYGGRARKLFTKVAKEAKAKAY
jgi:hypothetical protein